VRKARASVDERAGFLQQMDVFAPNSAGTTPVRLALALADANKTFPFLEELVVSLGRQLPSVTEIDNFALSEEERDAGERLATLFRKHGSDKASRHNYYKVYGPVLHRAGDVGKLLEVGLGTNNTDVPSNMGASGSPGASLRAFRDFLPQAQIFGADVDRRILFEDERIKTFFVDQHDLNSFSDLRKSVPELDVVIDDGLHSPAANASVFKFGVEKVRPGGWIIIEDISSAAVPFWRVFACLLGDEYRCEVVKAADAFMFVAQKPR